jgi:hypothetical protein
MKQIEENLNELLDVFDGSGVPNNSWVRNKLQETLRMLKINSTPDEVESEDLKTEVFMLANKLALSGEGDAAVRMHRICNSLWSINQ